MDRPLHDWDLALAIDRGAGPALFVRLARVIAADIQRGRLAPGARLPGTRALARVLRIHRNTVIAAYRELHAEGYLQARAGQATFVAPALPELPSRRLRQRSRAAAPVALRLAGTPPPHFSPPEAGPGVLGLFGGLPDLRLMPTLAFARAYRRVLRRPGLLGYGDARGHPRLREALAAMLRASRGLALDADQLVVTRGSQMALALAARTLFAPGDVVAVEALGYRPAWHALLAAGVELVPVPVDSDGLQVAALAALCGRTAVRAVYVTPHHQYPTTTMLAAPRRLALLELAARRGFAILEDDYDHEFHYDGPPVLPLASADTRKSVVYIGTLSKVLAPGIRIGFMTGPAEFLRRVAAHRLHVDRQGDLTTECAVAELFEEGEVQRHVRRVRRLYLARRNVFVESLRRHLGGDLQFTQPVGGMALWAEVTPELEVGAWLERCRAHGVLFQPGSAFDFHDRALQGARFGFACATEAELHTAVLRMKRARRRKPARRC